MMQTITPDEAREVIESTGTRLAYAEFVKRNGELRKMWFQRHISKDNLEGGNLGYDPDEKRLSVVFDIKKKGIRCIRWDALQKLCANHAKYRVKEMTDEVDD